MSKRERQRKQSISIAIAAIMFATAPAAFAATDDKAKPTQTKIELTAAAQSIGGSSNSTKGKSPQAPAPKPVSAAVSKHTTVSKPQAGTRTAPTAVKVTTSTTTKTAAGAPAAPPKKDAASQRYAELNGDKKGTAPAKAVTPQKKKVKKASTTMLVPPPPPTIPTYLNVPQNSAFDLGLGFSVPAMSLDDLKFQQKNVEKKLESAKIDERDQKRLMEREQERAKQFDGLFADGIVSRREFETAKEEADRSIRKLEQAHINVAESERLLSQIKERVQALEAAKKPLKISSKKSSKRK